MRMHCLRKNQRPCRRLRAIGWQPRFSQNRKPNVIFQAIGSAIRSAGDVHVNLGIAEADQMPEIHKVFRRKTNCDSQAS